MTPETFLEKFDLIADAPEAVSKMRELVLRLAFTGGLSEPSIVWNQSSVEEITTSVTPGFACSKSNQVENGHVHLRTHNISTLGTLNNDLLVKIDPRMVDAKKASIKKGDILFNNTNSQELVGKTCLVDRDYEYGFSNHINRIRLREDVDPAFVVYYFTLLRNSGYFAGICTRWINQAAVNTDTLKKQEIPLPPLAEQKRIVAKVDELMALCDRLEQQQKERDAKHTALSRASLTRFSEAPTTENLNFLFHPTYTTTPADLRKTILTLAVQGKLVSQDPNDEPAEDSLVLNDNTRRETAKSDHRANEENQPLLSGNDRWDIPDTWSWRGLADLVLFVDYRGKTPAKLSSGVRLLTAKNVRKGQINLAPEEFLSESEYHAWMTRGFPKTGDILFTTEAPMGNAAVVELTERFALAQRVICFQSYGAIDPSFLVLQLLTDQFQSILDKNGTGVTAKGIKASKLKQLPIALPPLAEQTRIVAKVDELMKLVDQLEAQITIARTTAESLLNALLADLTSQKAA